MKIKTSRISPDLQYLQILVCCNFQPLEVVDRGSETQSQVVENFLTILRFFPFPMDYSMLQSADGFFVILY